MARPSKLGPILCTLAILATATGAAWTARADAAGPVTTARSANG